MHDGPIRGHGGGLEALQIANDLEGAPGVVWASPNFFAKAQPAVIPSDPLFPDQWHLEKTAGPGVVDADIDAPRAWDTTFGNTTIVIAIIDDAVQTDHPDLNMWLNPGEWPGTYTYDDDGNGYVDDFAGWDFADDDNSANPGEANENHGTAVAGVAAADGGNSLGVTGATGNGTIMPIRHGGESLLFTTWAQMVYYAAGRTRDGLGTWRGADVLNMSFTLASSSAMSDSFVWAAANGRGGLGLPMFAATGNWSASTIGYPASHSDTIAVGASTDSDLRPGYSNYGAGLDFVAPSDGGANGITTTDRTGAAGYGSGDYATTFIGTSTSSSLAAGVAALLLAEDQNLTADEIRQMMRDTAEKIGGVTYNSSGFHQEYGYGRINALGAMMVAKEMWTDEYVVELNQFGDASLDRDLYGNVDTDSFYFALDKVGSTQIDVYEGSVPMDAAATLWDAETGSFLEIDYDGGNGDDPRFTRSLSSWHLYQVEVFSENDISGTTDTDFTLLVDGPTPTVTSVELDFDGDWSDSSENLGNNADADYYTFVAPARARGSLTVTAATSSASGPDTVVSLYDSAGTLLERVDDFTTSTSGTTETLTIFDAIPGETYAVRVGSKDYATSGYFSLEVNFGTDEPTEYYYATDFNTGHLVRIEPGTELVDVVGTPLGGATISGLALDRDGRLWGHVAYNEFYGNRFYRINRGTGLATEIGPIGLSVGGGMAYNPANNRIYTTTATGGVLVRINKSTGAGTTIGSGAAGLTSPFAAAFDTDNNRVIVFDDADDEYYSFDPSTGAATLLSTSSTAMSTMAMAYTGSRFVVNNDTTKTLRRAYPDTGNSYEMLTPSDSLTIHALEYVRDDTPPHFLAVRDNIVHDVGNMTGAGDNPHGGPLPNGWTAWTMGQDGTQYAIAPDPADSSSGRDHTSYAIANSTMGPTVFFAREPDGEWEARFPNGWPGTIDEISPGPDGDLLYCLDASNNLLRIGLGDGQTDLIGNLGSGELSGMTYDPYRGSIAILDLAIELLVHVDPLTGNPIKQFSLDTGLHRGADMCWDSERKRYLVVDGGPEGTGLVFSVDPDGDDWFTIGHIDDRLLGPDAAAEADGGSWSGLSAASPPAIHGRKFNDWDGDGSYDVGPELGLAGWDVFLDHDEDGALDPVTTTTLPGPGDVPIPDVGGVSPYFDVAGLVAPVVDVNVSVNISHPYTQSLFATLYSPAGTAVPFFSNTNFGTSINLTFDDEGTVPSGLLADFDFEDPNGRWTLLVYDAVPNGFGGTLNSWSIEFTHGEQVATTDARGDYVFWNLKPDRYYTVAEVQQPGWIQTYPWSPNSHRVHVGEREIETDINFGNFQPSEIHGTKWNDLDGDGVRDAGEPGLPGWEMYLDHNANGTLDPVTTTTVPGQGGGIPDYGPVALSLDVSGLVAPGDGPERHVEHDPLYSSCIPSHGRVPGKSSGDEGRAVQSRPVQHRRLLQLSVR